MQPCNCLHQYSVRGLYHRFTEGCMGEQASLEFDLTFSDVLLHKLVQAYKFNMFRYTLYML